MLGLTLRSFAEQQEGHAAFDRSDSERCVTRDGLHSQIAQADVAMACQLRRSGVMSHHKNVSNELIFCTGQDAALSGRFVVLMALSGVLAAVAFASGSIPVLMGGIIVAPLMTPLALVEGDAMRGLGGLVLLPMNEGLIVATGMAVVLPDQPLGREEHRERSPA